MEAVNLILPILGFKYVTNFRRHDLKKLKISERINRLLCIIIYTYPAHAALGIE
jgi:hypothetical protein